MPVTSAVRVIATCARQCSTLRITYHHDAAIPPVPALEEKCNFRGLPPRATLGRASTAGVRAHSDQFDAARRLYLPDAEVVNLDRAEPGTGMPSQPENARNSASQSTGQIGDAYRSSVRGNRLTWTLRRRSSDPDQPAERVNAIQVWFAVAAPAMMQSVKEPVGSACTHDVTWTRETWSKWLAARRRR
jgi:hypothetical protein